MEEKNNDVQIDNKYYIQALTEENDELRQQNRVLKALVYQLQNKGEDKNE